MLLLRKRLNRAPAIRNMQQQMMDALHVNRNPRVRLDRIAKVDSHHTLAEAASFTRLGLPAIIVLVQDRRDPLRLWLELGDGKGHELNTLLLLVHRLEQAILAA